MSSTATPSAIAFGSSMVPIAGTPLALGPRDAQLRAQVLHQVGLLHERGALQGGAANIAVRLEDADGHVLITARGLPRDLGPEDFGVVTFDGEFVAGRLGKGIRSVIGMHLLALSRPGTRMSIHSHSPYATAFAVAHRPIPPHYEPLYNRGQRVEIPVTRFGERDNGDLVAQIGALLAEHPDTRAVLLANHGVLAFHESVAQAADLLASINDAAAVFIHAQALGGAQPMARA
ncbi:MAG: class II aldolase/adducin family protein [Burkholderiaceae bacterium]|nr:class II aldolase/adducin family protein [Burkholderiaceae bacterium]